MPNEFPSSLKALVYQQVEMILRHDPIVDLSAVVAAVAQNTGVAPDHTELEKILDLHPDLEKFGANSIGLAAYKAQA